MTTILVILEACNIISNHSYFFLTDNVFRVHHITPHYVTTQLTKTNIFAARSQIPKSSYNLFQSTIPVFAWRGQEEIYKTCQESQHLSQD